MPFMYICLVLLHTTDSGKQKFEMLCLVLPVLISGNSATMDNRILRHGCASEWPSENNANVI